MIPALREVPTSGVAVLAALLIMRTALILLGDVILDLLVPGPLSAALLYANVTIVLVDVVTIVVLVGLLRRAGVRFTDLIGRIRFWRDLSWGVLAFVLLMITFALVGYLGYVVTTPGAPQPVPNSYEVPLWLGIWSITLMPITIAVAEECLYRGWLQHQLSAHLGWWPAMVVVALFFGLQHVGFSLTSTEAAVTRVITTFCVGLVFGALMIWLRRLAPLILAHWLVDVVGLGLPMLGYALAS